MGRVLSIEIVVLATSAAILLVRGCAPENRNPGLLHETEKACAIASSRLYTDVLQVTEGPHPGEHLAIAISGGGEGSRFDNPILLIRDRRDVKILMGIHAADDATCSFVYRHSQPPALTSTNGFAGPNARTGQSRDHEGQALLGSQASARQSLTARGSRAVDRSRERHGWSIGVRVRPHRAPHGASLPVGRSVLESGRPETGVYPLTDGLIGIAQNDVFKVLTIVSIVGIPPTLMAGIYGMNFKGRPQYDWAWGYPPGLAAS